MVHALGGLTMYGGLILCLLGGIFLLLHGFRESVGWGLAMLFVPFVSLIFLILHWSKAKNAFFLQLWGMGIMFAGAIAFHAHLPWPL
jgi:hypothetical protein